MFAIKITVIIQVIILFENVYYHETPKNFNPPFFPYNLCRHVLSE